MMIKFSFIILFLIHIFTIINGSVLIRRSVILTSDEANKQRVIHYSGRYRDNNVNIIEKLWKKQELTYTLLGNIAYFNQIDEVTVKNAIRSAFSDWQAHSPFTFIDKMSYRDADIKIIFTRDGLDTRGLVHSCEKTFQSNEAHAHAYFANHPKYAGEIHINNEKFWLESTNSRGVVSLKSILLHEIGHVLGLHHSNDPDSIMYPYFYTNNIKTISISDTIELHLLYRKLCD